MFWLGCVSVKWTFNLFFRGKKILWGSIDWFVWNEHLKAASLCLCVWVQSHLMAQCLDYFSPDLANSSTLWFLVFFSLSTSLFTSLNDSLPLWHRTVFSARYWRYRPTGKREVQTMVVLHIKAQICFLGSVQVQKVSKQWSCFLLKLSGSEKHPEWEASCQNSSVWARGMCYSQGLTLFPLIVVENQNTNKTW